MTLEALVESCPFLRQGFFIPVDLSEKRPLVSWKTEQYPWGSPMIEHWQKRGNNALGWGWIPPDSVLVVDVDEPASGSRDDDIKWLTQNGYDGPIFYSKRGYHLFHNRPSLWSPRHRNRVPTLAGRCDYRIGGPPDDPFKGYIILPVNHPVRRAVRTGEPSKVCLHLPVGQGFYDRYVASDWPLVVREGVRNDFVFHMVCSMRATGHYDEQKLPEVCEWVNRQWVKPPLGRSELAGLVQSALRYPAPTIQNKEFYEERATDLILDSVLRSADFGVEPVSGHSLAELEAHQVVPIYSFMEPGQATLVKGPPKAGKSTFVRSVADRLIGLGKNVAWLCLEEGRAQFAKLANAYPNLSAVKSDPKRLCIFFSNKTVLVDRELLRWMLETALSGYHLIIVDPFGVVQPDREGQRDYDRIYALIGGVRKICAYTGAHSMLIHHKGKNQFGAGQSSLGSTAYDAAPDNLVEMKENDLVEIISRSFGRVELELPYDPIMRMRDLTPIERWSVEGAHFQEGYEDPFNVDRV